MGSLADDRVITNDPGTAIAAIEAGTRVLAAVLRHRLDADHAPPPGVPPFALADLLDGFSRAIACDGAGTVEVGIRVQEAWAALDAVRPEAAETPRAVGSDALARRRRDADERWRQGNPAPRA